eukprot:scaffold19259_cov54-Attheya_sp.AAC.2
MPFETLGAHSAPGVPIRLPLDPTTDMSSSSSCQTFLTFVIQSTTRFPTNLLVPVRPTTTLPSLLVETAVVVAAVEWMDRIPSWHDAKWETVPSSSFLERPDSIDDHTWVNCGWLLPMIPSYYYYYYPDLDLDDRQHHWRFIGGGRRGLSFACVIRYSLQDARYMDDYYASYSPTFSPLANDYAERDATPVACLFWREAISRECIRQHP